MWSFSPLVVAVPTVQKKRVKQSCVLFPIGQHYHHPFSGRGSNPSSTIRDWSLIMGRGGLQNGKIAGPKLFAPPPQDRVKLFTAPLLKSGNFSRPPPYNMAKTSSYCVKTTLKLFVPPLQHG